MKRHGDPKKHGAATITYVDFEHLPDIVKSPDYAIVGAIRKETLFNVYAKVKNSITYMYFEEVLKSRRNNALRGKTLYKVSRVLSFNEILRNVSWNGKTDITKARILTFIKT